MMSLTGQHARYIYTLSRNSQIYRHCALGIRALFSSTVVSFGLGPDLLILSHEKNLRNRKARMIILWRTDF